MRHQLINTRFGEPIWMVDRPEEAEGLTGPVYTASEIQTLHGAAPETVEQVHRAKRLLGASVVSMTQGA